ncbi:MAG TPA: AhpC/TSA family protein [Actinomycetospora sp.]|nr:AhpC/TSA family protein [Actinomycetospora sp.]
MQDVATEAGLPVVAVGFSPPAVLRSLAEYLSWRGAFLSDEDRVLYRVLGLGRAPWWRVYSPGTLAIYARGRRRRGRPEGPEGPAEDTRQLGGDAVVRDGVARVLWTPRSPDDRVAPQDLVESARSG